MNKVITISVPIELASYSNEELRVKLVNAIYQYSDKEGILLPYNHRAINIQFRVPEDVYSRLKSIALFNGLTVKGAACNLLWSNHEEV